MTDELRVKISEWLSTALHQISGQTGMDYSNITRMALMEYLEKRLTPRDYDMIFYCQQASLKDAIFEFEHYNRILKKYKESKADNFKKLFIVALQQYKKLGHTFFREYKTNIPRFNEVIYKEPGVIDLLDFVIRLDKTPLPDKDQYTHLLKEGKQKEYYNKKWDEVYNIIKDRVGLKEHKNYAHLTELKINNHLRSDTDAMYYLYDLLKKRKQLPKPTGHETYRLVDGPSIDPAILEELIRKYGVDFDFIEKEDIPRIAKSYGELAQIDHMIKHFQDTVDARENYIDKTWPDKCKEYLKDYKEIRKEFIKQHRGKGLKIQVDKDGIGIGKNRWKQEKELAKKMIEDPNFGVDKETYKQIDRGALMDEYIKLDEERENKKQGKKKKVSKKISKKEYEEIGELTQLSYELKGQSDKKKRGKDGKKKR